MTSSLPGRGLVPKMTSNRYYGSVMPIAAVIYVIVMVAAGFNVTVVVIGAFVFALISVIRSAMFRTQGGGRRPQPQPTCPAHDA